MIIDLIKADETNDGENTALIKGVISTEDVDLQGEIVKQKGLDFSHFEKSGVFNYEHRAGAENVLGYPTSVKRRAGVTEIEGVLLLDQPKSREILRLAKSLEKAGKHRRIGFSVEGSVLARDPYNQNIVTKAKVLNCAITTSPVNPATNFSLIKGLISYYAEASSGGGPIAPLVPQQLSNVLSVADSQIRDRKKERLLIALSSIFNLTPIKHLEKLTDQILKELNT